MKTELPLRWVLALASLAAATIHFGFAPAHLAADYSHGAFFLATAWFQLAWAVAVGIAQRPTPLIVRAGIVVNLGVMGVWLASRTVGISGAVEPLGYPDTVATLLEGLVVIGALTYATGRLEGQTLAPAVSRTMLGAATLAIAGLVSASMLPSLAGDHGPGGHHGAAGAHEAAGAHDEAAGAHDEGAGAHDDKAQGGGHGAADGHGSAGGHQATDAKPYDPDLPIDLGGVEGVTAKQEADAEKVVERTLDELPQWSDPKKAEAAGYRSIGDGITGHEHLINQSYMDDDVILDPDVPESLVYDTSGGGRRLVAAMYMLKRETPLEDAPDIGGALMQWHVHDNLCYSPQGRVEGITSAKGTCRPGLFKPAETPMIHVWIEKNSCGPFAALEGLGAGAVLPGEERLCDEAHGS